MLRGMRALSLLLLLACPDAPETAEDSESTDTAGPVGDPNTIPLNGTCDLERRWGTFEVEANEKYSVAFGAIANGVVPVTVLTEVAAEGDCRLLKRENPYCNPTCEPGDTCDLDGVCIPYPENQNVGTVTIAGLTSAVSMDPLVPGNKYSFVAFDGIAFEPGKLIELVTGGGAYAPQTLHGVGVTPLVPASLEWVIAKGASLDLSWDAPAETVRSSVFVSVNVDQHGITPVTLECAFADNGTNAIASSVIDALLNFGISGFPSARIQRRTVDKVMLGEGCADFIVDYEAVAGVTVSGHTPCSSTEDCPADQECNLALQTCE